MHIQYWHWFDGILHGNFGTAYSYGLPVMTLIGQNLIPTLELQCLVIVASLAISVPIGVTAAVRRNSAFDHVFTTGTLFGLSMPNFWFALLLILLFSVKFHLLPAFGVDLQGPFLQSWSYFVFPAAVLSLALIPWYARFTRASMSDSMQQDYVRTARACGVSKKRILFRDALKPALRNGEGDARRTYLRAAFARNGTQGPPLRPSRSAVLAMPAPRRASSHTSRQDARNEGE